MSLTPPEGWDWHALQAAQRVAERMHPFMDRVQFCAIVHTALVDAMFFACTEPIKVDDRRVVYQAWYSDASGEGWAEVTKERYVGCNPKYRRRLKAVEEER